MSSPLSCDPRFAGISFSGTALPRRHDLAAAGPSLLGRPPAIAAAHLPAPIEEPEVLETEETAFLREVVALAGLDPARYRMAPLLRRLPSCLRTLRVASVQDARQRLQADEHQVRVALGSLLIGTTAFFRDPAVFRHLELSVIPDLLKRHPKPRVWSAACSDGAELHSIAMLLADQGALAPGHLLGTDYRARAIEAATDASYPAEAAMGVPGHLAARFLVPEGNSVRVATAIRQALYWERRDVFENTGTLAPWDLILCRNLAIYLSPSAVESLWKHLAASLAPGGILVVGKAEKPRIARLQRLAPCIYRHHPSP